MPGCSRAITEHVKGACITMPQAQRPKSGHARHSEKGDGVPQAPQKDHVVNAERAAWKAGHDARNSSRGAR